MRQRTVPSEPGEEAPVDTIPLPMVSDLRVPYEKYCLAMQNRTATVHLTQAIVLSETDQTYENLKDISAFDLLTIDAGDILHAWYGQPRRYWAKAVRLDPDGKRSLGWLLGTYEPCYDLIEVDRLGEK